LAELMANEDFMRFSPGVYSYKQTAAFREKILAWQNRGLPSQFAVLSRADNRLIGYCGFFIKKSMERMKLKSVIDCIRIIGNKGLATEAAQAVRDHAFRDLNLSRVISLIHPKNAASRRVAEKIRMQFEHKIVFKGFPALVFMINRERWLTNRAA
jgi:[ribosomal protein S5]-alanine N-acetyltransferase